MAMTIVPRDGVKELVSEVKKICVYCGSNPGKNSIYSENADRLGALMGKRGIDLVYGAGTLGLMGSVARAVIREGGQVTGVAPTSMKKEIGEPIGEIFWVKTMHQRKAKMMKMADAFITLPGGIGTMEELMETATAGQLGMHRKVVAILNVNGYYNPLLQQLDKMVEEGFLSAEMRQVVIDAEDPETLLDKIKEHQPPIGYLDWTNEEED